MPSGLLQRLLTRSGVLPFLRRQWRDDQHITAKKLEERVTRNIETVASRAEEMAKAADAAAERIAQLDREVRMLRATLALNAEHRTPRYPAPTFEPNRVAAHVARAITSALMHTDPTPHLVIDELLPTDTYQALVDAIPPRIFFSQRDNTKQDLKPIAMEVAPERTFKALGFMEEQIIPQMIVPMLFARFETHIRSMYQTTYGPALASQVASVPHVATRGRLMLRRPGYHLDPHLDPKRVVVTCLIYFARPGDSEAYGTSFYRINGVPNIDRTSTFYPRTQGLTCDLVKTVPFRPNSAVAFLNFGAAHGADIPKSAPRETERYAYQFYVSPEAEALAALVGEAEAAIAE